MLEKRYSDAQLHQILEQAAIYDCACPAQICVEISNQRRLYVFQENCINRSDTDRAVHQRISAATLIAHRELEACLSDVLVLEGWDLQTLQMPADLAKRLLSRVVEGGGSLPDFPP